MKWHISITIPLLIAGSSFLAGCASGFTTVAPTPPDHYQKLGTTTGSACGSLGILGTSTYFIPMTINSRVDRAYNDALSKVSGAKSLANVTMQEDWYWWLLGTTRCVTVSGEAIR